MHSSSATLTRHWSECLLFITVKEVEFKPPAVGYSACESGSSVLDVNESVPKRSTSMPEVHSQGMSEDEELSRYV